jgi:hypothetical protein
MIDDVIEHRKINASAIGLDAILDIKYIKKLLDAPEEFNTDYTWDDFK